MRMEKIDIWSAWVVYAAASSFFSFFYTFNISLGAHVLAEGCAARRGCSWWGSPHIVKIM